MTGASKGIGRETAISFARAGATQIAILARSDLQDVEKTVKAMAKEAGREEPKVLSFAVDVTDKLGIDGVFSVIEEQFGGLDIVVNNAGYMETFKPIAQSDVDQWWKVWHVNMFGTYLIVRASIPLLLKNIDGLKTIVNVSSVAAHLLMRGASSYQTSKFALLRFTESINAEYGEEGIICHVVHPGSVMTEMASGMPAEMHHVLSDTLALGADTLVWLTAEKRQWLAGRYISSAWDMEQLAKKKAKITEDDLLRVRMDVGTD